MAEQDANHPLAPLFGKYADDPTWEDFSRRLDEDRKSARGRDEAPEERDDGGHDIPRGGRHSSPNEVRQNDDPEGHDLARRAPSPSVESAGDGEGFRRRWFGCRFAPTLEC